MNELIKIQENNYIKIYFEKILELSKSGIEYPVNLEDVWNLVYERKDNATKALRETFIETVDYELRQNAEVVKINDLINGIKVECFLSLSCFEYFIARKVREVFNIYRSVFHRVSETSIQLPNFNDPIIAARAWADAMELKNISDNKVKELSPKAKVYDQISDCTNLKTVSEVAKIIGTGGKRLFKWMREQEILMHNNIPYQKYIDQCYFMVKTRSIEGINEDYTQTFFTSKGELWITKIWNNTHSEHLIHK
jgi:phage antirepressor YoqD-like protein